MAGSPHRRPRSCTSSVSWAFAADPRGSRTSSSRRLPGSNDRLDMETTLTTARLRLRLFREDDLDAYAAMCADAEVMRHIGIGGPVARDAAWRHMALFNGEWTLHGYGMWAV